MRRKLFMLTAATLTAMSMQAAEWVKPEPKTSPVVIGDTVYLYNVGARMFFTEGNKYSTQASVGEKGLKVFFSKHLVAPEEGAAEVWDGKTVLFNDSSATKAGWRLVFIDSQSEAYVDRGNQPNYFWHLTEGADGAIRLSGADLNPTFNATYLADTYLGLNGSIEGNTALSPMLCMTDEFPEKYYIDWKAVTLSDYQAWLDGCDLVDAALALYELIQKAQEMGIDTSAAMAVYENTGSTLAEISAAASALQEEIAAIIEGGVSPDNPKDMTDYIANASYDNNDATGWKGNTPGFDKTNNTHNAEFYNTNYNIYQELTGLPNGVYHLSVQGYYRAGTYNDAYNAWLEDENGRQHAKVYAMTGKDTTMIALSSIFKDAQPSKLGTGAEAEVAPGMNIPDNMVAAAGYFAQGYYADNSMIFCIEDGTLTFGIRKDTKINRDWTIFDNWKLTYYGSGAESFKHWASYIMSQAPDYASMDELYCEQALLDAYYAVMDKVEEVSTKEGALALLDEFNAAHAALKQSIEAYNALYLAMEEAEAAIEEFPGEGANDLSDYLIEFDDVAFANNEMPTADVVAVTVRIYELIDYAKKTAVVEGSDCTALITNANFDERLTGWSYDEKLGKPGTGGLATNPNVECYNANFDFYQDITGVPNGVYRLDAQAFYRSGSNDVAWSERETAEVMTTIYLNAMEEKIPNVMSSPVNDNSNYPNAYRNADGTYTPNSMNDASGAFTNGLYECCVYGVVTDGTMRIGIHQLNGTANQRWSIWDNFRLTYEGYNADVLAEVLVPRIAEADILSEEPMQAEVREALLAAITAADAATDGQAMFEAISTITDAIKQAKASVALYATLSEAYVKLCEALELYSEAAMPSAVETAVSLVEEIEGALDNGTYSADDIAEALVRVDAAIVGLKLTDEVASDEHPIDYTYLIVNPNYDNDNNEGWQGTAAGHQSYGNAEFYNTNYDMYQVINGLPEGTYKVAVKGYYRAGDHNAAYTAYTSEDSTANLNAYVYAESAGKFVSAPMQSICAGLGEEALNSGNGESVVGDIYYIPNSMQAASLYFENGRYAQENAVIIRVTDGTLKFGLLKTEKINSDWTLFDSWTLTYYGAASVQEESGDPSAINEVAAEVVAVTYHTLDGIQVDVPGKGLCIVRTVLSDGTVVIRKILNR
ncbi:MAG: hypothetical protein IJE15_09345 [Bacteroidaceae bacterium]|nr:hypothetical protein [Bacteroidaceae bacterium]